MAIPAAGKSRPGSAMPGLRVVATVCILPGRYKRASSYSRVCILRVCKILPEEYAYGTLVLLLKYAYYALYSL